MKYYTIYKITNKINGKYYVGKHITEDLDDGYMGSGKYIKRAIKKYGKENFNKEIIKIYDNEHDMNIAESILINLNDNKSYNLQPGGIGGWSYINEKNLGNTEVLKQKKSKKMKEYWTIEKKNQKSKDMKKMFLETNLSSRMSELLKIRYENPEYKKKFIEKTTESNNNLEKRIDASKKIKKLWKEDEQFKEKMKKRKPRGSNGNALKEKWKDPIWRKMMLDSRKKKKSKKDETNKNN